MNRTSFILFFIAIFSGCINNDPERGQFDGEGTFDQALAKELEADDYGMSQYVVAFLKSGERNDKTEEELSNLQRAHLDNIQRLADEGKLLLAGPFVESQDLRGIYIFDVKTLDEARLLTETDPAIQEGVLEMELHKWYASAALRSVYGTHKKISKENP